MPTIDAWPRLAAMQWISLLFTGMALVSGCTTHVVQPQRSGVDVTAYKPNLVHGITQVTANGKERFIWCGACQSPTPKVSAKARLVAKDTSSKKLATVIHFDFDSTAIKSSETIKLTGLLKGIGSNTTPPQPAASFAPFPTSAPDAVSSRAHTPVRAGRGCPHPAPHAAGQA